MLPEFAPVFIKLKNGFKRKCIHVLNKIPSNKFYIAFLGSKYNKGIIITLHRVLSVGEPNSEFNSFIEVSALKLEEIILNLKKLEVRFVTLHELNDQTKQKTRYRSPVAHLSFDDGYYDNYSVAFDILKTHNVCFSIFVTSDFVDNDHPFLWWYMGENIIKNEIPILFEKYDFAITKSTYKTNKKPEIFASLRDLLLNYYDKDKRYFEEKLTYYFYLPVYSKLPKMLGWKQIIEMVSSGLCEVGVHTKDHARFANLETIEKIREIEHCKKEILHHTGINSTFFAYPFGDKADIGNTSDLEEIMTTCGIELAFTTIPGELNNFSSKVLMPRTFLNDSATMYTLKTRLNGSYQRGLKD